MAAAMAEHWALGGARRDPLPMWASMARAAEAVQWIWSRSEWNREKGIMVLLAARIQFLRTMLSLLMAWISEGDKNGGLREVGPRPSQHHFRLGVRIVGG